MKLTEKLGMVRYEDDDNGRLLSPWRPNALPLRRTN